MAQNTEALDFLISAKDNATSVFKRVEGGLDGIERAFGKLNTLIGVGFGVGIFGEVMKEASKAEEASNRLNAVLKATGFAGGLTKRELDDMADSLHQLTQFEDEAVRGAEAVLLKFGNIQNDVFREALKLSADYAAFVGGDMSSAAQAVGKALQSPTEGLKALEREMGKLSPTQKQAIERFMELNDLAGAQGVVLDFLRGKIAGTAEIMNTGLLGGTSSLTKAWGEFLEKLGRSPAVAGTAGLALELLKRGVQGLDDAIKVFDWKTWNQLFRHGLMTPPEEADPQADEARRGAREAAFQDAFDRQMQAQRAFAKKLDDEKAAADKKAHDEYLAREKRLEELSIKGWAAYADAVFEQAAETDKALAKIDEERNAEEDKQRKEDEAKQVAHIDKMIELEAQLGLAANDGLSMLQAQQKEAAKVDEWARQMGLTFSSAFEDAIIQGKSFSDVLKGIEQDLARIIIRKAVTEPIGSAIGDWAKGAGVGSFFNGLFGGGGGGGGSWNIPDIPEYALGTDYVPRTGLALLHQGEQVVPAGAGGVNLNVTMNIQALDSRSVAQAIAPLKNQIAGMVNQVMNERGRAGPFGR